MTRTLVQLTTSKQGPKAAPLELRIGDLAKATGKTQRALRLYEELGLLAPNTHTAGGFRLYGADAIERVRFIGKLQDLGFTLPEIQALVEASTHAALPKESMAHIRSVYAQKQREVQLQIERLRALQGELASSLAYLETCVDACTQEDAQGTSCCGTCGTHGHEKAPSLVEGARQTTAMAVSAGHSGVEA